MDASIWGTRETQPKRRALLENRIETPQDLNPKIPLSLSNLVMDCVSVRPQKRPADMEQVNTRLELARHTLTRPVISPNLLADPEDSGAAMNDPPAHP